MPPTLTQLRRRADEQGRWARAHLEEMVGSPYGITIAANIAGPIAVGELGKQLSATAAAVTERGYAAGQAAGAGMWGGYGMEAPPEAAVAEFFGPDDERTCELCRALLGQRFAVGSAEYYSYMPPVHVNCRHKYIYYRKGEAGAEVDFTPPPPELVAKHGHFISQPHKYEALRVPAGPTGRDFIVRRVKDPDTGEIVTRLDWLKQPPVPPSPAARETLVRLLDKPLELPAAEYEATVRARRLEPLIEQGWLRVLQTRGAPQQTTVLRHTPEEVRSWLALEKPLAVIDAIEQVGQRRVAGATIPEWQVVYRESDSRRIQLTRRGRLAALVAAQAEEGGA